ncbi:hypothetical protein PM082_023649 [Marasmius tenuissimus]|nr:hypothetical protein PM082_023649 [Marasmius tenuissimus]
MMEAAKRQKDITTAQEAVSHLPVESFTSPKRMIRPTESASPTVHRIAAERARSAGMQPPQPTSQPPFQVEEVGRNGPAISPGLFGHTLPSPGPFSHTVPSVPLTVPSPVPFSPTAPGSPFVTFGYPPQDSSHPTGNSYGFLAPSNQAYGYSNVHYHYPSQNVGYGPAHYPIISPLAQVSPSAHSPGPPLPTSATLRVSPQPSSVAIAPATATSLPPSEPTAAHKPACANASGLTSDSGPSTPLDSTDDKENMLPSCDPKETQGPETKDSECALEEEETLLGREGLPGLDEEESEGDEERQNVGGRPRKEDAEAAETICKEVGEMIVAKCKEKGIETGLVYGKIGGKVSRAQRRKTIWNGFQSLAASPNLEHRRIALESLANSECAWDGKSKPSTFQLKTAYCLFLGEARRGGSKEPATVIQDDARDRHRGDEGVAKAQL